MATKPGTVPAIWSPSANYTTGPFIGQPTKVLPGGAVAVDGHRPGAADPTPAEYQNYQQHWSTQWIVNWLSQGLATPAANTHIIETDANGRTEVIGLDMTDPVDRTVSTINGANTAAPAVVVQTAGNGIQVENTGAGVGCFSADMTGGSAIAFTANDNPADSAQLFSVLLQGNGGLGNIQTDGATSTGLSIRHTASSNDLLSLTHNGTGAPLRLTAQVPPAVLASGKIWLDSLNGDLEYVNTGGSTRRIWGSEQGYSYTYQSSTAIVPAGGSYTSFNYGFVLNKRYIIRYGFSFGRTVGSTQHPINFMNVGGIGFPPGYGEQIYIDQDVPVDDRYCGEFEFTSPATAILLVDLFIGVSAGAAQAEIQSGWISVTGALD